MKWRVIAGIGVVASMVFGATVDVIAVSDGYYVRNTPSEKGQFSQVDRHFNISQLTEAHIIPGEACYDEFFDTARIEEPISKRVDCEEYYRRAFVKDYPT